METLKREYAPDHDAAAAAPLLLPRRPLQVLGPVAERPSTSSAPPRAARCSCSAPTGSAATCSRRIIYGARISLTDRPASASPSASCSASSSAASPAITAAVSTRSSSASSRSIRSLPELPLWLALSADPAGDLEPAPGLFRHHRHPRAARLDGPRARGALQAAVAARGGLSSSAAAADGRQARPHHRPPSAARLHEPPDRLGHALDPAA